MSSELLGGETADPAQLIAAAEARLDAARRSGATPPPMTGVIEKANKQPKRGGRAKQKKGPVKSKVAGSQQSLSVADALEASASDSNGPQSAKPKAKKAPQAQGTSCQTRIITDAHPGKRDG